MARRPPAPRPARPGGHDRPSGATPRSSRPQSAGATPGHRPTETSHLAAAPARTHDVDRAPVRTTGRRTPGRSHPVRPNAPAAQGAPGGSGEADGVVQAADRFRRLVRPRPWRRRRRTLAIVVIALGVLLVGALGALLMLPYFAVQETSVSGITYVDRSQVDRAVASAEGTSELLLPTSDLAAAVEEVPGVRSATVQRQWPHGMLVTVTERQPLATVTDSAGATMIVDADGTTLPAAAGEAGPLAPLQVGAGSADHGAATTAMLDVLAALPEALRARVTAITATTTTDVTLTITIDDGATKSLVWGDAQDPELKAEVTAALLDRPGTVIDVSAPSAPVTR